MRVWAGKKLSFLGLYSVSTFGCLADLLPIPGVIAIALSLWPDHMAQSRLKAFVNQNCLMDGQVSEGENGRFVGVWLWVFDVAARF